MRSGKNLCKDFIPVRILQTIWVRYITSQAERVKILRSCHIDPSSGHMGRTRTINRIKERFMWKGILKDVFDLVCNDYVNFILLHG